MDVTKSSYVPGIFRRLDHFFGRVLLVGVLTSYHRIKYFYVFYMDSIIGVSIVSPRTYVPKSIFIRMQAVDFRDRTSSRWAGF